MIVLSLFIGNIYALLLWTIGAGFFLRLFLAGRRWRLKKRDKAVSDLRLRAHQLTHTTTRMSTHDELGMEFIQLLFLYALLF
jgi:hypothetical protein